MNKLAKRKKPFPFAAVFAVSVFIFAGWVYFFEYKGEERRETEKTRANAILPFATADVREIRLRAKPGGDSKTDFVETALIKKSTEKSSDFQVWNVEAPYRDLADAMVVDAFISALSTESITETVVTGESSSAVQWSTYGLDQPAAEATLKAQKDGVDVERRLVIGSVPAFDGSVYARLDGANSVVTMSANVIATLQKDPREFRDKRFFSDAKFPEVSALQILRPGFPKIDLALKDGVWSEREPRGSVWPLDQGIVKSYVDSVLGLRGSDVWAEDKTSTAIFKARRLDRPAIEITVLGTPTVTEATKGKTAPSYQVKLAGLSGEQTVAAGVGSEKPLVFSVYKAQIESLTKTIDDFRDLKHPFQFKLDQIQAIEFERAQGAVSLPNVVRREKTWALDPMDTRFPGRELRPEAIDSILTELLALQARRLVPPTVTAKSSLPKVSDRGAVRVGLFDSKNRPVIEFVFHPQDEVVRVSSSATPNRVFEIDPAAFDKISFDVLTPAPPPPPPPPVASEKEKK